MPWDLVGHDWAATMLAQHIRSDAVKHAYLLCGPDGVGRRSLALRFAQALTCVNSQSSGDPCLSCSNCQRIARMQHPDLFVVSVPENRKEILIEQVRTLQHDLSLAPYEAPVRIGLLLNFQNASDSAQNAILKTLEEPTTRVILLVTASRPEDLLPTISSRCEVLLLRPASVEDVAQALEKQEGVSKDVATQIAHLSGGCYGQALSMHKNPETIEKGTMLIEGMLHAMAAPLRERFSYAEELTARKPSTRQNLQQAIRVWISFWRDVLIINSGADAPLVHVRYEEVIRAMAATISLAEIHTQLTHLEDGLDHLNKNANTRLLAEILVMELPHLRQPIKTPI
jgi:DNA polymerase-3 subunit delta'